MTMRLAIGLASIVMLGLTGCVVEAPRRPVAVERPAPVVVERPGPAVVIRP